MYLLKTIIVATFLLIFFSIRKSKAQESTSRIVSSLNEFINPIKTISPDSNFSDLEVLRESLKDKTIISLGEATHGTREFFLYKDGLIRFLVSELGYKAIAFEADFSAVQNLDDYINSKTESINTGQGGFPLIQETRSMLSWLRTYNQSKAPENRVHLYGLEARGFSNICGQILNSLISLPSENRELLRRIQQTKYFDLSTKDINGVRAILPYLYNETDKDKNGLNRHCVTMLDQVADNYLNRKFGKRDEFMAANATWILENTNSDNLIIWAHNGHISKSALFRGASLGTYLYQKYNTGYFAIATDFNQGEASVFVKKNGRITLGSKFYPEVTSANAYEYYFNQCKFQNFMINISALNGHEVLVPFFSKNLSMKMVGGTDGLIRIKLSILENFDLIVFLNKTTSVDNKK
ncbi:Erythromycin esterase homolog [Pedobacter sp. ok626]|uniref:erythromycin esterase family protein n=1 Tax=Pedobacter sp. ok626 TaxID=1761882 RepID=UPI000889DE2A|nr:erythromycin esterase family protein [Pedobacter sp. ok626]SDL52744.1 Erythromycin esterase homolog [Pedobacter sp. ok626]